MGVGFYSLKDEVDEWLRSNKIVGVSAIGLGRGCRGVELWFSKETNTEFLKKYPKIDGYFHNGWFTKLDDTRIYVSMTKRRG